MQEKNTEDLANILKQTNISGYEAYVEENRSDLLDEQNSFFNYIKDKLQEKKLTQQVVFLKADIPERYGYKLLSGEKHTKQRDVILRICYAAELTLEETQRALEKYELPRLYAKIPRDALLMIIFNQRPGSIIEVNELMKAKGQEPLRSSGYLD